jgi:hypothetical protein
MLTPPSPVEAASAMEAPTTVKPASSMKAATAVESAAMKTFAAKATTVKFSATKAAIKAPMEATIETAVETPVKTPIKETITVPEAKAPPRASTDEDAAVKPLRTVVTVRSASIRVITVIPISASRGTIISGPSNSNAKDDALRVCVRSK